MPMMDLSKCLINWPCRGPTVAFASTITNVALVKILALNIQTPGNTGAALEIKSLGFGG